MQRLQQIVGIFFSRLFMISFASLPFWRITHDSVLIQYITLLIDEFGRAPYTEIFDTALPGTLLFHLFIGKVFGNTEAGAQLFNFLFCSLFMLSNFILLKGFLFCLDCLEASFLFIGIYHLAMKCLWREILRPLFLLRSLTLCLTNLRTE